MKHLKPNNGTDTQVLTTSAIIATPAQALSSAVRPSKLAASRKRRGIVAHLPKAIRDRINEMLDDGLTYPQIRKELGPDGKDLTDDHIRRWKAGGYQDHLREQRIIEQCRLRQHRALTLLQSKSSISGFQATQQIASSQICEIIAEIGADILREALMANPMNYFRTLNAFARLSNGGLRCERHLLDEAQRLFEQSQKQLPAQEKGITPESVKQMQDKLNLM